MKTGWFAALALAGLCAAAPPQGAPATGADRAGNRMLPLAPPRTRSRPGPLARQCTADHHWCARLRAGAGGGPWSLELTHGAEPARRLAVPAPAGDTASLTLWPQIVIERSGAAIVGVERIKDEAYTQSEGGDARLSLVRAEAGSGPLREVLEVPTWAYIALHMCPHPGDAARRHGACWDRAEFSATLRLDPRTRAGMPRFVYGARARTYPARGVLERDLDWNGPLRRADLRWAIDPACTYRRSFAYRPGQGRFVADGQFPRCPDYFGF